MRVGRTGQIVAGCLPLALFVLYAWNPLGRGAAVLQFTMVVLAVWSLFRASVRGRKATFFLALLYAVAAIGALASFLSRHHSSDAVWAGGFSGFAAGWAHRHSRSAESGDPTPGPQEVSGSDLHHG